MRADRTTSTTSTTGNSRTTGTPAAPRRRRLRPAGALTAVLLAAAGLTAVPSPGTAAVQNSDARLISTFPAPIVSVYSTSTERVDGDEAGAATSSGTSKAATAVSKACAGGAPLAAAQWYTLPVEGASRVTVVRTQTDRDEVAQEPVSFGFVTSDTREVLSCGDAPVSLPANRPVLLVAYFAQAVPKCVNDDEWAYWCDVPVTLATVHRVGTKTPANDDWQNAKKISGDTFSTTVDTSTATFDGLGPIRGGECFLSQFDPVYLGNVWFEYQPSKSGHVHISARSPKPGYWAWPVIAELGPDGPIEPEPDGTDECIGTTNVEAGKKYLIGIGGWYSPYFGESNPIGGEVFVSVGQAPAQRVVRDLRVSVDNAARSARLDWGIWEDGGPTPSGFRVGRSNADGTAYNTLKGAGKRTYTFKNLKAWEPYLLSVETLGPDLTVHSGTPRASAFAYLSQPQPSKPLSVSAKISGYKKVTVRWTPPAFDGDSKVTRYRVRQFSSTGSTAQKTWWVSGSKRSLAVTGLSFNKGYRFDVTAENAKGKGQPSARTSTVKLTGIPSAPTGVKVSKQVSKRTATLTWKPPASTNGGKVTGYKVARKGTDAKGKKSWSATVSAKTGKVVFKNLKKGTTYTLYVRAVTAQGAGTRVAVKVKL